MTPQELQTYLQRIVDARIPLSVMIWGAPGIGKSSVVAKVAEDAGIALLDLRLSQLAPTDLRGLPVPENGVATWYPPEFLPREGAGILFLDEINMAAPSMQGVAQQLILDRRVGSYCVPDGWLIWAAGNRKFDQAAVFDMPSALANRFIHLDVEADASSFRAWGIHTGMNESLLAFLAFRPSLLHQMDVKQHAWPSPRSWAMGSALLHAGLSIAPAVGVGAAAEFEGFRKVYADLPNLDAVAHGKGKGIPFPREASAQYAATLGLVVRTTAPEMVVNALRWLIGNASGEWAQFFILESSARLRASGQFANFVGLAAKEPAIRDYLAQNRELMLEVI